MDEKQGCAAQRREEIERQNALAPPRGHDRFLLQKKWNVGAERRRQGLQLNHGQRSAEQLVQPKQRHRRVATPSPQTRSQGNSLFQVDSDAFANAGSLEKLGGRAVNQVLRSRGQLRLVARKLNGIPPLRKAEMVAPTNGMHHCFQLVEAVRALAENVQEEVDFAGRVFFQECRHKKGANTGCWRQRKPQPLSC